MEIYLAYSLELEYYKKTMNIVLEIIIKYFTVNSKLKSNINCFATTAVKLY